MTTMSPVLSSSGESTAHFDAEEKYCRYGFPYIQAKTFKGLLRESCLEVCEMLGYENYNLIDELFGTEGAPTSGVLAFNDLKIFEYHQIEEELGQDNLLKKNTVREFFTVVRQQTSINDKTGTAKDKSLRKYRLIKEGVVFETTIENIPKGKEDFLKKALLNLRYIGTRRNRGFGKVKFESITNDEMTDKTEPLPIKYDSSEKKQAKLNFEIETFDTLILSKIIGEQNTVNTEQFIPAVKIRGVVAGLIINNENLFGTKAHQNENFKNIILSGSVKYNNAFKENLQPIPKIYGYDKTKTNSNAEFISEVPKPLKGFQGFAKINDKELKPDTVDTVFSFHSSRCKNRLAGRSTEEDGAIFYYEAIDKNQVFKCEIQGICSDLEYIKGLLEQKGGIHRIGRSKSAQYSRVKFNKFEIAEIQKKAIGTKSTVYIVFQSPVIVYNEFGTAIPDLKVLKNELSQYSDKIEKVQMFSSPDWVENYMGTWQSKTPRESAFAVGTTLKVDFFDKCNMKNLEYEGLGEHKNEGYGRLKLMNLATSIKRVETQISPSIYQKNENSSYENQMLKDILQMQKNADKKADIEFEAIEKAVVYVNKISNSLIARLKHNLQYCNDMGEWKKFISSLEGKEAYKKLDRIFLWDDIENLEVADKKASYHDRKIFYLCFLKILRVKSKSENK